MQEKVRRKEFRQLFLSNADLVHLYLLIILSADIMFKCVW